MGRRSRARGEPPQTAGRPRPRPSRPAPDERPPAPWGSFPLSELLVLLGIVLMAWGLLGWEHGGAERLGAGILVASLAGLELSLREHLAGYRSHSTLLAGVVTVAVVSALVLGPGPRVAWALVAIAAAVFAAAFVALRVLFKRRSGGLGFR